MTKNGSTFTVSISSSGHSVNLISNKRLLYGPEGQLIDDLVSVKGNNRYVENWTAKDIVVTGDRVRGILFDNRGYQQKKFNVKMKNNQFTIGTGFDGWMVRFSI